MLKREVKKELDGKIKKERFMNGIIDMQRWKYTLSKVNMRVLIIQKLKKQNRL